LFMARISLGQEKENRPAWPKAAKDRGYPRLFQPWPTSLGWGGMEEFGGGGEGGCAQRTTRRQTKTTTTTTTGGRAPRRLSFVLSAVRRRPVSASDRARRPTTTHGATPYDRRHRTWRWKTTGVPVDSHRRGQAPTPRDAKGGTRRACCPAAAAARDPILSLHVRGLAVFRVVAWLSVSHAKRPSFQYCICAVIEGLAGSRADGRRLTDVQVPASEPAVDVLSKEPVLVFSCPPPPSPMFGCLTGGGAASCCLAIRHGKKIAISMLSAHAVCRDGPLASPPPYRRRRFHDEPRPRPRRRWGAHRGARPPADLSATRSCVSTTHHHHSLARPSGSARVGVCARTRARKRELDPIETFSGEGEGLLSAAELYNIGSRSRPGTMTLQSSRWLWLAGWAGLRRSWHQLLQRTHAAVGAHGEERRPSAAIDRQLRPVRPVADMARAQRSGNRLGRACRRENCIHLSEGGVGGLVPSSSRTWPLARLSSSSSFGGSFGRRACLARARPVQFPDGGVRSPDIFPGCCLWPRVGSNQIVRVHQCERAARSPSVKRCASRIGRCARATSHPDRCASPDAPPTFAMAFWPTGCRRFHLWSRGELRLCAHRGFRAWDKPATISFDAPAHRHTIHHPITDGRQFRRGSVLLACMSALLWPPAKHGILSSRGGGGAGNGVAPAGPWGGDDGVFSYCLLVPLRAGQIREISVPRWIRR
jgi:hypothetical protein